MPEKKGFKNLESFVSKSKKKKQKEEKETELEPKLEQKGKKETTKQKKEQKKKEKKASMQQFNKLVEKEKEAFSKKKKAEIKKKEESVGEKKEKPRKKTLKKKYFPKDIKPIGDEKFEFDLPRKSREKQISWHLRYLQKAGEFVEEMEKGILLSMDYSGQFNKAYAKFYDLGDDTIKIWMDTTNHRPYCIHRKSKEELSRITNLLEYPGYDGMETVEKIDLLQDKKIEVTKIYGKTPNDIGGVRGIKAELDGAWEANIRYHHNFIYDRKLVPGMMYKIKKGQIEPIDFEVDEEVKEQVKGVFSDSEPEIKEIAKQYQPLFYSPVPSLKRLAFDIEVADTSHGGVPNPRSAKYEIISVAFAGTDGMRRVYVLDRKHMEQGEYQEDFPEDSEVYFFKDENELLRETFRLIWDYPIIITFNGDNFDNLYLYHRARKLGIDEKINPIFTGRGGQRVTRYTYYKHSIHWDIYQFYANRSIKGYAFGSAYLQNSLEEVASGLLGEGKVKHEDQSIGEMNLADLIYYNLKDSELTLELTTFNNNLAFHLLVILMRITKLPFQDLFRYQISTWIKSLMINEHRQSNYLVPRRHELSEKDPDSGSKPTIKGKGFKGAYVIKPVPGIHFNVAVLDFSSLYPSIIKTRNLSYETVNCVHEECEENFLPNTRYYACTKKLGVFAYVVGFFRDIRVNWFKPRIKAEDLTEEEQRRSNVMASALKVFINGAYGVFGSPVFQFYCLRVAEATTAIGRYSIKQTIEKSESMGVDVLYGDSDSVFLKKPTEEQVNELMKWSEEHLDLDLELEKTYQFLGLSERKKNYIGVYKGGNYVDIKGLMAKKHNTPEFIKKKFSEFQDILKNVTDMDDFRKKREEIIKVVKDTINLIGKKPKQGGFDIEDYAITISIKKKLDKYVKTTPQHVKAARMLPKKERDAIEKGSFIRFVKTRNKKGVKPLKYATIRDLDYEKYRELVKSTFEQVLDALQISYGEVKGVKKLSSFF